jgi:hypothetical protein
MTEPLSDAGALIATPFGQPGSGRQRYGAAMALFVQGRLSAEALEVYRICAARDAEDPGPLLAARGLSADAPPAASAPPEAAFRDLVAEADLYLSTLPGPGVAEVRSGIATARGRPVSLGAGTPHPVIDAHLSTALAVLAGDRPALAAAIARAAPLLDWRPYDSYPPEQIGAQFAKGHAFASLIGEGSPLDARDYDLGLFLIAPHVLYRDHHHKAPELYAPLTGPHGWRFGPGRPLIVKAAHVPVWNDPLQPHLTKVGAVPFLALFGWTRDVTVPAEVIPADDWPALEALRLGDA